jgi:hypothetical protein
MKNPDLNQLLLEKTLENKELAINTMYQLWNLGIATTDMMDEIRAKIDKRYENAKSEFEPF